MEELGVSSEKSHADDAKYQPPTASRSTTISQVRNLTLKNQMSIASLATAVLTSTASTMDDPAPSPSRSLRRVQEPISTRRNMDDQNKRMVWIDLEMTGLDLERESIIEIATIITDSELNIIAEGPNLAVSVSEDLFWENYYLSYQGTLAHRKLVSSYPGLP